MSFAIGVLLGTGLAAVLAAAGWLTHASRARRIPAAQGMQTALHAATATLPHLRRGLTPQSAAHAVGPLRTLTGAAAVALADTHAVLAIDGQGREQVRPGDLLTRLLERTPDDRLHIVRRLISSDPTCPLHSAVLAPLVVQSRRVGTLITFYTAGGRPHRHELQVVTEAASLVAAQIELSVVAEQEERLALAELRALRAQISPHFIYNALAAVAGYIHHQPEEARELLSEFAEFTRYLFRDGRPYVSLAEEMAHVQRYLRLEQARFGDELNVTLDLEPEAGEAMVPVLSVQPLVENAVRHGAERRPRPLHVEVVARRCGDKVEVHVSDDGRGIAPDHAREILAGRGSGVGLGNVDGRLRATFGERYALRIESRPHAGTTVTMTVPHLAGSSALRPAAAVGANEAPPGGAAAPGVSVTA